MANSQYRDDDHFGRFEWRERGQEWLVQITVPDHEMVTFGPTEEYFEDEAIRDHIRKIVGMIIENEATFRTWAVDEAYDDEWYLMFCRDNPVDKAVFFREMHLAHLAIEQSEDDFTLWYEYEDGVEHAILIYVSWDGLYQYAHVA